MRKIPEPPAGAEQWRGGWELGYEACLIDRERAEEITDGPRTWQIEYPPAPPAGTRVQRYTGGPVYVTGEGGRTDIEETSYSWKGLLEMFGPLTEVVETEVEAAARRLREADLDSAARRDIDIVLKHVLNGGSL